MEEKLNANIICGNNFGDLGLITKNKYIEIKKNAHDKLINALLISEIYDNVIWFCLYISPFYKENHYSNCWRG